MASFGLLLKVVARWGSDDRPIESLNFLFKVGVEDGAIAEVVTLPDELNAIQRRFGLEGVAYDNGLLVAVASTGLGR